MFGLTEFAIELMVAWLLWSGALWVGLTIYRYRRGYRDALTIALPLVAIVGWACLLRLTTGLLGGRELVPVDLPGLIVSGLPYYALGAALAMSVLAVRLGSMRSRRLAIAGVSIGLLVPTITLPLLVNGQDTVKMFSHGHRPVVAVAHPQQPILDPAYPGMVYVPAGPFVMGSLSPEQLTPIVGNAEGDEQPVRTVYLDGFFIDRFEVTNRDFGQFVGATGHVTDAERVGYGRLVADGWYVQPGASWRHPVGPDAPPEELDDHPVTQVSWNDARSYCAWSDKRLPSEAEWEKAARGVDGREYPWGTTFQPERLNYCAECDVGWVVESEAHDGFARTAPVGSYPQGASPYGALDMAGNVWEWVEDWYDPEYYRYASSRNPRGPPQRRAMDLTKVVRGGSWTSNAGKARTTSRSFDPILFTAPGMGFRCAADD